MTQQHQIIDVPLDSDETLDASSWIAGATVPGSGSTPWQVVNPADGEVVTSYAPAGHAEVDAAVAAAKAAFGAWSSRPPAERSDLLHRLAQALGDDAARLARVETSQTGKPIRLSTQFDVPGTVDNVAFFAGASRILEGTASGEYSADHTSSIRREAVGVVGSIAPWNYPLQMAGWKILPAVAAGNTIVLKPSELTPLTALMMARAATRVGFPDGVINVITGDGPTAGQRLVGHPDVDMVSFTGSTAAGRAVMATAAASTKRLHLELGGKAPFVVFDDADLEAAVHGAVSATLINGGQDCTAATRAIVHSSLFEAFVSGVADLMAMVRLGDPLDEATDQGPLVSFAHRDRVAAMVARATADGAHVVRGGAAPAGALARGAYYEPTLLREVSTTAEVWREEVFGPVLVAVPFTTDDEAIALANDTPYGLAASAWTTDVFRAQRAAREIRAGCVWINDHIPIISEMPHGGFKASGFGKDMSRYSMDEYTVVKHVMSDITGRARKPWHETILARPRPGSGSPSSEHR